MALAFRSSSTASNTTPNVSTFSVSKPAGVLDGDLLVMFTEVFLSSGTPSGWTPLLPATTDGWATVSGTYYKIAASEPSSYSVPRVSNSTAYPAMAMILAYTGGHATQPAASGRSVTGSSTGTTTSPTPALLSPVGATDLTLICYAAGVVGTVTYGTTPAGWTSRGGVISPGGGATNCAGIRVNELLGSAARPTMTSTSAQVWNVSSVALAAAVVTATPKSGLMSFFM